jgi:hypothetical protein
LMRLSGGVRTPWFSLRGRHAQRSLWHRPDGHSVTTGSLMGQKTYFAVVGIIFALVALAHAVRVYMEWPVIIGDWSVPKSVSWVALVVAGGLALLAFRFAADKDS